MIDIKSDTGRNPVRVAVLGAGLAGLSAADYLTEQGVEVLVLEKDDHPGGLAATFRSDSFHFDYGPHRFHTENPEILKRIKELLHTEMLELNRLSRIRLLDRYFQYPLALSDVLQRMPFHRGLSMVLSYLWERLRNPFFPRDESNFENWVVKRFGRQLYSIYFGPYTEKLWGCNASKLSADWASQRITVPGL
ncbi:MAG: FAD-dependent oxidoreductase, partial [Candidatus Aegiribacteria sp.]|nr:FAD-dependent oxidoreductase [Candidatus Aegiribacteria sp.]